MLEKIKNAIFEKYQKSDCKGLFFSVFDENNRLLMSNGTLYTDKVLDNIVDTLYHGLVEKYENLSYIIIDVVTEEEEITSGENLNEIPLEQFGIALIAGDKHGAILPNTQGVTNIQDALKYLKEKNGLEGNARIIKFKTDRFVVFK